MKNISELVSDIIEADKTEELKLVENEKPITHNKRKVLNRINCYINSQYSEFSGTAIFWNIITSRITHFAKLLGLDTKDFMPYGIGEYNMFQSWALKKFVRKWFNDNEFYKTLNDISEGLATYGSMVWKKYKENGKTELEEVDLTKLYFNQRVKCIDDADGVVELHTLSLNELWEKDGVWDNVPELIKKEKDCKEFEVWEFWGYHQEDDERPVYKHIIGHGFGNKYTELWNEEVSEKDFPYYDFHLGRYRGRWLRVGVPERLFDLQERANELVNQNAESTKIASLLLFKSSNGDATGNVLEQAINGQILTTDDLEQIGINNTGLNQFIAELQMIERQADTLCLTPSIIQGESTPSNTTFRGIAVISSSAKSAFTSYLQDLGEKIASILVNDIFPGEVKKWAKEPFIEIAEDDGDIEMYDKAMLEFLKKEAMLSGQLVTPELEAQLQQEMENKIETIGRRVVPEDGWINFKWGIKMMPTTESIDKSTMNDAYWNALSMIGANPTITTIPLFKQYLEDNGITWTKLTPKQQEQLLAQNNPQQMPEQKKPDALLAQANAK